MPSVAQLSEASTRFGTSKQGSLMTILPQVAGPLLGGLAGRSLGARMGGGALGETLGTIGGMTAGRYLGEEILTPSQQEQLQQQKQDYGIPPGAPYALDPSTRDIPMWALQGARMMRPFAKQSAASDRPQDVIFGEIPGYSAYEGYRQGGVPGAIKGTLGQVGGAVGGGAAGYGIGRLLSHMLGRDVNIPLINFPLSHLLAGVGATMGATKGFQKSLGLNH